MPSTTTTEQLTSTSKVGEYYLAADATEQARLNSQYEMVKVILDGKLGLAPVHKPRHVLDVATGTGVWAIQYGQLYPESQILGIDLRMPKPPTYPPSCEFLPLDAEYRDWNFPENFDYVHLGHVVSCFDDTKSVMRKIYDNMTPGGWVEFHDSGCHFSTTTIDDSCEGTAIEEWCRLLRKGGAVVGRDLCKPLHYTSWLREVGFENVTELRAPLPSNSTWPTSVKDQEVGALYTCILRGLIDSVTRFVILAGLSADEAEALNQRAKEDARNPDIHFAMPL